MDDLRTILLEEREYKHRQIDECRHRCNHVYITLAIIFLIILTIGVLGYMYLFDLSFIDALYATTLNLTTQVIVVPTTNGQKIFVIFYSLLSIIFILGVITAAIQKMMDNYVKS